MSIARSRSICSCRWCTISSSIRRASGWQTSSSRGLSESGCTSSTVSRWHNIQCSSARHPCTTTTAPSHTKPNVTRVECLDIQFLHLLCQQPLGNVFPGGLV